MTTFKIGHKLVFMPRTSDHAASMFAIAEFRGDYHKQLDGKKLINVHWIKRHNGQSDGEYYTDDFIPLVEDI